MTVARLPKRFALVRELGTGGMGAVYEAVDNETGARVAIKTLPSSDADRVARFKHEFRALQGIHHSNLVTLGELFCEDGQWAFSMDLVEGTDFLTHVRGGPGAPALRSREVFVAGDTVPADHATERSDASNGQPTSVRPGPQTDAPSFDEERLRDALAQLARALDAVHTANRVHRDVKPSNIRVRPDGHVVLLDFGLIVDLDSDDRITGGIGVLGTPAYMSPEQASRGPVDPASDLYSVGVMLFEALTGRLPFEGRPLEMMMAKTQGDAPEPKSLRQDVPDDLNAIAKKLLARDPRSRPGARDLLRALEKRAPSRGKVRVTTLSGETRRLVGREDELATLARAYDRTLEGRAACVVVEGESGIGKSFLVQQFLARLREDAPGIMVLSGRCYEKESVPYKAFDGVIDSLVRQLVRLPSVEADALLPSRITPLVQTFPIFQRIEAVARARRPATARMDPLEIRSRAFTALREMFDRISQQSRLVIAIDDMQWSDQDSMGLLAEILREPTPPPFLLLLTARPKSEGHEAGARFREVLPPRTPVIALSRLREAEAAELAGRLLAQLAPARVDQAAAIAEEGGGHALFIEELARYAAIERAEGPARVRLEDVLAARIAELEARARRFLRLLCVAGAVMPQVVLGSAAGITPGALAGVVADLRAHHFIRTAATDGLESVEPYHDRVRAAAIRDLDSQERAADYEALALAFGGTKYAQPHVLAELWRNAGDVERAGEFARIAAEQAVATLAFGRAATFYAWALERPSLTQAEQQNIRVALGETLAKAGRGAEAAAEYQHAARNASTTEAALDLERRAAEQLLRVGQFTAGLDSLRALLARVGLPWPRSVFTALVTFLCLHLWRRLRGYDATARGEMKRAVGEELRLDACYAASTGLAFCDNIRAAVFHQRYMTLALASGNPGRVSLAYSSECMSYGRTGAPVWPKTEKIVARSIDLATRTGDAYRLAYAHVSAGVALYFSGRFRAALPHLNRGQELMRDECPGTTWEVVTAQMFSIFTFWWLGDGHSLLECHPRYLREATERGDVFGIVQMSIGFPNFAWLLLDDAPTARQRIDDTMARLPDWGYRLEDLLSLVALGNIDLYEGDAEAAHRRLESGWARMERSFLRQAVQSLRITTWYLRARALVAVAEASPTERAARRAHAERIALSLRREVSPYGPALGELASASCAAAKGDEALIESRLRRAVSALDEADILLFAAVARRHLGKVVKGDEGAALVGRAEDFLRAQGVRNIAAMSRCLSPGFSRLE